MQRADIGIFGRDGFYELLENSQELNINTPYGYPSDKIAIGQYKGKKIALLPRHGKKHQYPPHLIPYRANLFAFKKLGVTRIIAPRAVGSLKPNIKPGDFVICNQFVDRTAKREDSYFQGKLSLPRFSNFKVAHVSPADPTCPELNILAKKTCDDLRIKCHLGGTIVVIDGPRYASKSESIWYRKMGWDTINMTAYPEIILARELQMCYLNICLITDYDAGLEGFPGIKPVDDQQVIKVFNQNNEKVKRLILKLIENMPSKFTCQCQNSMKTAGVS